MAVTNRIDYRLPLTTVRLKTIITTTTDKYGPTVDKIETEPTLTTEAMFITTGDPREVQTFIIRSAALRDLSASIGVTNDLRLTSMASESTGQLGTVLSNTLGIVTTIAGLASSAIPTIAEDAEDAEDAYMHDHSMLATQRKAYQQLLENISKDLLATIQKLVKAPTATENELLEKQVLLRTTIEDELHRLNNHYDLWREAARSTQITEFTADLYTDSLPQAGIAIATTKWDCASLDADHREIWEKTDAMVTIDDLGKIDGPTVRTVKDGGILLRVPRPVVWRLWGRPVEREGEEAVLVKMGFTTVVDRKCKVSSIQLRRSLWARRTTKVDFSDMGALINFESNASSSVAAAAMAFGGLPESLKSGLESANAITTAWHTAQDAKADHELARLKVRIDLKQQALTEAGLKATQQDYVELKVLEQKAALATVRKSIDPTMDGVQ